MTLPTGLNIMIHSSLKHSLLGATVLPALLVSVEGEVNQLAVGVSLHGLSIAWQFSGYGMRKDRVDSKDLKHEPIFKEHDRS